MIEVMLIEYRKGKLMMVLVVKLMIRAKAVAVLVFVAGVDNGSVAATECVASFTPQRCSC